MHDNGQLTTKARGRSSIAICCPTFSPDCVVNTSTFFALPNEKYCKDIKGKMLKYQMWVAIIEKAKNSVKLEQISYIATRTCRH